MARKQDGMGRRGRKKWEDLANLPSKLSNYVNQEFSKCQHRWRGRDLGREAAEESERERAQRTGEAGDRPDRRDAAVTLIN